MNVLYYTNPDVSDIDLIPDFIKKSGDTTTIITDAVTLDFVIENEIDFIVSDRSRYIIKKDLIDYLPRKIVNLHPSYLPWNRGYNPNYWSIRDETPFGVTLHYIDEGIDTGNILAQTRCFYNENDTLSTTYERLRYFMVKLFYDCWPLIRNGDLPDMPQGTKSGSLHYKREFTTVYDDLTLGWDTPIIDIIQS